MIFVDGDNIEMVNIIGNGVVVNVERKSIEYSLVVLTAS